MRSNFMDPELYTRQNWVTESKYLERFHIMQRTGLLNDPTGLIEYQGQYHLFYQTHPFAPRHDMKYWFHY